MSLAAGWMIGVLLEIDGAPAQRHHFAVAHPDQARAEWAAADLALACGTIATSPHGGMEPVEAIGELSARAVDSLGLSPGQAKALGWRSPRRWLDTRRPAAADEPVP